MDKVMVSTRQLITAALTVLGILLLWKIAHVLLLSFAGILLSILLVRLAGYLRRYMPVPHTAAIGIIIATAVILLIISSAILAPQLAEQYRSFANELPKATEKVMELINSTDELPFELPDVNSLIDNSSKLLGFAGNAIGIALNAALAMAVVVLVGFFISLQPSLYEEHFLHFLPKANRQLTKETLNTIADVLWRWLLARFMSMAAVGLLTFIGLTLLGVPLAFPLGIIAGLLSFIPNLGPILSLLPAVIIGVAQEPSYALFVPLLYIAIQAIEGNFITPFVEQYMVSVPAGLVVIAQLASTALFGFLGLVVATPLTLCVLITIHTLYNNKPTGPDVAD